MSCDPPSVTFIGHATLLVDMDGTRVLTDPLLRDRVAHLYRHASPPLSEHFAEPDVVLISHLHLDHLDLPSLVRLGRQTRLVVPAGAASLLRRRGFTHIDEVRPGDAATVGSVRITATPARHSGFRPPIGPTGPPLGFVVAGSRRVYFAGDTDLFPEMSQVARDLDVALLPVWGWGRVLGPGHLDPERAAEALRILQPRLAIPIHWGTFAARAVRRRDPSFLVDPPRQFAERAALVAPDVVVRVLQPGECTSIAV